MPGHPPGILAATDRIAPSGAFTSPAAGNVSGTITLTATAADNDQVASVQFRIDGSNIGAADTAAPFTTTYDTHGVLNGAHTLSAVITDRIGNQTTVTQAVTVQNAPVVSMTSPAAGNISGTVTISASVTHYDASCSTQFLLDGANYGAAQGGAGTVSLGGYDTHLLAAGSHTFQARSTDGHGNVTTSSLVTCTVTNALPASGNVMSGGLYTPVDGYRALVPDQANETAQGAYWDVPGNYMVNQFLPANPDSTHYQMYTYAIATQFDAGTAGNHVYGYLVLDGVNNLVADNGWTGIATRAVAGGNGFYFRRFASANYYNNCSFNGVGMAYYFTLKAGYLS